MRELQQTGVYAKTECISALDTSEGDTEKAILALEKMAMRPMLQRVLNSCLPDHATENEVFMALTRQINTESQQEKANFEAIVTDKRQNLDVSNYIYPWLKFMSRSKKAKFCKHNLSFITYLRLKPSLPFVWTPLYTFGLE